MAGTKRKKQAAGNATPPTSKKPKQDDQTALSKDINVPIDEGFGESGPCTTNVYIDADGVIFDASLNQTNISGNNNKFYCIQLLQAGKSQYFAHTRWGRVGEFGQKKTTGPISLDEAIEQFRKKFKEKSGLDWDSRTDEPVKGKYTFIEKSYASDDEDQHVKKEEDDTPAVTSKLPIQTQRLVELIFNENHFNSVLESIGYNQEKLPLGKLSKATLKQGFEHLKELSSLIKHPGLAENKYNIPQREAIEEFSNKYYSTIPHISGRQRPPLIDNNDILQKEVAMLDTLSDMEIANKIMKNTTDKSKDANSIKLIDQRFQELSMDEMTPLEPKSKEYQLLKDYLVNTAGHTHDIRYRLREVFRIARKGESDRFLKSEFANRQDSCRRLLWHGSRTTNFGGILSQGLRIAPPESPVNGYAFGKGLYLADISSKSANYSELGNPMYELLSGDSNAGHDAAKAQRIATFGVGRTVPQGWVDAGAVHESLKGVLIPDTSKPPKDQTLHPSAYLQYNEYICYNVAQLRLRYLLRFQT